MWSSTTLPRQRPNDPPPPPPHKKSATLLRNNTKTVDVNKLKSDIEILSHQLDLVKARLESALAEQNEIPEIENCSDGNKLSRDNSTDSRLSTMLLLSASRDSCDPTPTPQISEHFMVASSTNCMPRLNKPMSQSASHLSHNNEEDNIRNKRFSICLPSSSSNFVPTIKRRETFSKVEEITKELQTRMGKVKRTESLTVGICQENCTRHAPPKKPARTFQSNLEEKGECFPQIHANQRMKSQSSFSSSSVAFLSMCNHKEFVDAINKRFTQGQCWFSRGGQLYFVNPFNSISNARCQFYSVIPTITASLFENKNSALFLRGVSGSGKSHIAEMICSDIVDKTETKGQLGHIFKNSLVLLRPFISTNNTYNNQCSKSVAHYIFQIRENRLQRIVLRHFPIESMSRGCRANIFAMVANDMSEIEKEQYKINGFRLRQNCKNYGNFKEVKHALTSLGINAHDILKVISACILLNNINFQQTEGSDFDTLTDLEDASYLLGISALSLYRFMVSDAQHDSRLIRDNFVTAIYTRLVKFLIDKINILLDGVADNSDIGSQATDSGISVGTCADNNHIIHIIDVPGYVRSVQNSLNELVVNSANDILQCTDSDMVHQMLKSVENATRNGENWIEKPSYVMKHCAESFEINYDLRMMLDRNSNFVPSELINLFDYRSCSFEFCINLFATDVENLIINSKFISSAINWPSDGKTVIQNFLEAIKKLRKEIGDTSSQQIICLKSNECLEYARVHENGLGYQLNLYRAVVANSAISTRPSSMCNRPSSCLNSIPHIPPFRQYVIRDGRKHYFPQRRNVLIDFQDPKSGVMLRAGEVVKAVGLSGEFFLIETSRRRRAAIPRSFTEKCAIIGSNQE